MPELASLFATVHGRVQGVFFRAFAQEHARALGLTGYVRNTPGGKVEVCAEGEKEHLEELVGWLEQGPPWSRVERVDVEWGEWTGQFSRFEVRH